MPWRSCVITRSNYKQELHPLSFKIQNFTLSGEAFIGNESLSGNRSSYLQSIGYCPQFDSIIEVVKHFMILCRIISISFSFSFLQGVDWSRDVDSLCSNPRPPKLGKPDQQRAGEVGQLRRPHPVLGQALWAIQRRQQEETQCCPRSYWKVRQHEIVFFLISSNWPII